MGTGHEHAVSRTNGVVTADEDWVFRIAHLDDLQAGVLVCDVCIIAHDMDSLCDSRGVAGATQSGVSRIADVNHLQTRGAVCDIGIVASDIDGPCRPGGGG